MEWMRAPKEVGQQGSQRLQVHQEPTELFWAGYMTVVYTIDLVLEQSDSQCVHA